MHHKNIRLIVRKQLKKQYPNWNRLTKKVKKEIIKKVLAEYGSEYDFSQDVVAPPEELLGIDQQVPCKGIMNLSDMAQYINMVENSRVTRLSN